ncbi:hypothetical protein D9757_004267 [Collybiopsis confluens]|uniref:General stress protein FMN-binding split barrel domain-containing protein n=1 Tax=Collybiopsis confluens TaxID=2823264 RepID=A0A8H5HTV6_9AGAR|nr:hypothetical protein D9757_004267 [Collybiopsis confluens]
MTSAAHTLDPYTAKAENTNISAQEKIKDLHEIVKAVQAGMLTTRSPSGHLHSRAMIPVAPSSDSQTSLLFFANKASHKFDEIENDAHVNVSFSDPKTTSWASYVLPSTSSCMNFLANLHATSLPLSDLVLISLSSWFGDLKDGVHKGDENDPRVSIIEVIPDEIRYWIATKSSITRALEIGINTVTGGVSVPGELRTIDSSEIQLTQGLHKK